MTNSNSNATSRDTLLKTVNLLRPALATQNYIPAWTHIRFADGFATAYNDVSAIMVKCAALEEELCLPGDLLIRALGSFKAESIILQPSSDGHVQLVSGRSKIKLPTLKADQFPYALPTDKSSVVVPLDDAILKGVELCLPGVGKDPTHPAQLGVTLDVEDGRAVLYSTDNYTISRAETSSKMKLPADAPIILPTFFAEQLLSLAKVFKDEDIDLRIVPGALVALFGSKARLSTKTLVDLEPLDFGKVLARHVKLAELDEKLCSIPDAFESAFERALLVLAGDIDKVTKVTATSSSIKLRSTSAMGDADDTLPFEDAGDWIPEPIAVDPALVLRGSKGCAKVGFLPRGLLLASEDTTYLHMVSYCAD